MTAAVTIPPVLGWIKGQDRAVAALAAAARSPVHAYLLVGPPGSGKRDAAVGFAAALLCPRGGCGQCEACRRVLEESHPDLAVLERTGASITVGEAREVIRLAARSPMEGERKVLLLTDFHLVGPAAPALLKTIEEPPGSAIFVITAEHVSADLVTIASRCVKVELSPLSERTVAEILQAEGFDPGTAAEVAAASGGRIDRARLLVDDPGFAERRQAWRSVPGRLDGTGATVMVLAAELLAGCESALEPLKRRQAEEAAGAAERAAAAGTREGGKDLEERHRRQQRRVRTDELRAGLSALAEAYRDRLVAAGSGPEAEAALQAVATVERAGQELVRNPNESLLLHALLARLGALPGDN